jgi:hypothetical protein
LLRCKSPEMAQSGHDGCVIECPLLGGKADIISVLAGDLVKRCKGKAVTGAQARLLLLSVLLSAVI